MNLDAEVERGGSGRGGGERDQGVQQEGAPGLDLGGMGAHRPPTYSPLVHQHRQRPPHAPPAAPQQGCSRRWRRSTTPNRTDHPLTCRSSLPRGPAGAPAGQRPAPASPPAPGARQTAAAQWWRRRRRYMGAGRGGGGGGGADARRVIKGQLKRRTGPQLRARAPAPAPPARGGGRPRGGAEEGAAYQWQCRRRAGARLPRPALLF